MIKIYQNNKSRHCEGGTTEAISFVRDCRASLAMTDK
jgi:hypothetical protein